MSLPLKNHPEYQTAMRILIRRVKDGFKKAHPNTQGFSRQMVTQFLATLMTTFGATVQQLDTKLPDFTFLPVSGDEGWDYHTISSRILDILQGNPANTEQTREDMIAFIMAAVTSKARSPLPKGCHRDMIVVPDSRDMHKNSKRDQRNKGVPTFTAWN